jgi:hypothetical protein
MFSPYKLLRRCLLATSCLSLLFPVTAQAQTAVIPSRVGQITSLSGNVSYNGAGSGGQWIQATANYPVTSGDTLFTQAGAEAAIVLNSSRLTLGANTELQITGLDDAHFTARESQGEVFLNLSDVQPGQSYTIDTPRGAVTMSAAGAYDITAGDAARPTTVSVLAGSAQVGPLQIPAGQEGVLSGTGQALEPLQRDAFEDHAQAEMMPPPPPYAPPVVQQISGVDELSAYGSWSRRPEYGAIWYPYVPAGWAPFREGHWAYIAPWGWTWVDMEPWGFAPFHYGRWIDQAGRWGWVPVAAYVPGPAYGPVEQPVYAPAVVGFFGLAAGAALTGSLLASQSIGWVPLAPGEPFYPAYHADRAYLRRINQGDVRHFDPAAHQRLVPGNFVNRWAATYIPASAMAHGASVAYSGRPVTPEMFGHVHPLGSFPPTLHPDIRHQPAAAPQPSAFATRHEAPPIVPHSAVQPMHPGARAQPREALPPGTPHGPVPPAHPGQETQPHEALPPRPPATNFHPPVPEVYRPHEAPPPRPPAENFHPPMPAYHSPAPQFRPPMPQPHAAPPRPQHQEDHDRNHP